ncbi:hypothetical protein Ancab_013246 [Ancistrocladus abbreviatus]
MEKSTLSYSHMGQYVPMMSVSDKGKEALEDPEKFPSQQASWGHQNAHTTESCLNSFVLHCPDLGQSSMYGHDDAHLVMKSNEHAYSHKVGQKEIKLGCPQSFSRKLSQRQKGSTEPLSFLPFNNQEAEFAVPLLAMHGPRHQVGLADPLRPLPGLDQGAGFAFPPSIVKPLPCEVGNSHDRSCPPKLRRTSWGTSRKSVGNSAPRFNSASVADFINRLQQITRTTGHASNHSGIEDEADCMIVFLDSDSSPKQLDLWSGARFCQPKICWFSENSKKRATRGVRLTHACSFRILPDILRCLLFQLSTGVIVGKGRNNNPDGDGLRVIDYLSGVDVDWNYNSGVYVGAYACGIYYQVSSFPFFGPGEIFELAETIHILSKMRTYAGAYLIQNPFYGS